MEEEGIISLVCPHCKEEADFPEMDAGHIEECPFCRELYLVPEANGGVTRPLPIPHRTPRLILRKFRQEDFGDAVDYLNCPEEDEVDRESWNDKDVQDWLKNCMESKLTQPNGELWLGIEVAETGKIIGAATIRYADVWYGTKVLRAVEFDLGIHSAFRGQGCGTETVGGLLELCFCGLNFRKVISKFNNVDEPRHRILAKSGFRKEGVFVEDYQARDKWVDTAYYAILRREFNRV